MGADHTLLTATAQDVRSLLAGQSTIINKLEQLMATGTSILAAQAQEKTDLAVLVGLVQTIVTNAANGNVLTQAQAQQIQAEMQAEDSTIAGLSTSITAALNPPAASTAPATGSAPAGS